MVVVVSIGFSKVSGFKLYEFGVDTEDAEVESVDIQGEEGIMASKNGIIQIAWANQKLHSYFNVNGPESMREDLIKVAQGVKIFT